MHYQWPSHGMGYYNNLTDRYHQSTTSCSCDCPGDTLRPTSQKPRMELNESFTGMVRFRYTKTYQSGDWTFILIPMSPVSSSTGNFLQNQVYSHSVPIDTNLGKNSMFCIPWLKFATLCPFAFTVTKSFFEIIIAWK